MIKRDYVNHNTLCMMVIFLPCALPLLFLTYFPSSLLFSLIPMAITFQVFLYVLLEFLRILGSICHPQQLKLTIFVYFSSPRLAQNS